MEIFIIDKTKEIVEKGDLVINIQVIIRELWLVFLSINIEAASKRRRFITYCIKTISSLFQERVIIIIV